MNYYPIGTVVRLHGGTRSIMIYGRKQLQVHTNTLWDYVACLYPEENLSEEMTVFFQQEEIAEVLHLGYLSALEGQMQAVLLESRQMTYA